MMGEDRAANAEDLEFPHFTEQEDNDAVDAALTARRPLLVRGEPGVGKTQLAKAAARRLGWAFCHKVIDARTDARDLKWTEDLVSRLADAQMIGATANSDEAARLRGKLDLKNYIRPGPLWWAFNWTTAEAQIKARGEALPEAGGDPSQGVVVLIDEIDKAEVELPNGLLEAMGAREFTPPGHGTVRAERWPLIVVTTNEERQLPDAFIRRCVVHDMRLPSDAGALEAFLAERGRVHFPDAGETLLKKAAEQTVIDRIECGKRRLRPLPGQAEYLDLLRAVIEGGDDREDTRLSRLEQLSKYFLRKHPELR